MNDLTTRLARASARRPGRTLAAWGVAVLLSLGIVAGFLGSALSTEARMTNDPESYRAEALLGEHFPPDPNVVEDVVVVRRAGASFAEPPFRAHVEALARALEETGAVRVTGTPYAVGGASLVSADRDTALLTLAFTPGGDDRIDDVIAAVDAAERSGFETAITGEVTADHDFQALSQEDLKEGEIQFGLPAAMIVLLLVFGSVVAGLVPVLAALVSIVVSLALTALVGQAFDLSVFVVNMLTGMGLALGIDYALFVVSRYREERNRGREQHDAIVVAGATANRAVLFSGSAFVLAMAGMVLVPDTILRSLATGAILVGVVSVVASLTLLPALLGVLGDRVNALRIPWLGRGELTRPPGSPVSGRHAVRAARPGGLLLS